MKPLIDISSWQDPNRIDYDLLAASVRGVILRCAYGLDKDTEFEGHYRRLSSLGAPLGVYHFPLDGNANAQVDLFGECIEGKYFELGGAVDVEHPPRPDRLSKTTVDTFIAGVRSRLDAKLAIYTTLYKWREIMRDSTDYASHPLWVANYGARVPSLPVPWKKWCIWQYSDRGRVQGYAGNLDLNRYDEACLASIKPLGEVVSEPIQPEKPFKARVITNAGLAVRKAPSKNAEFVRWLPENATVTVYAIQGDWWRIDPIQSLWSASRYGGEQLMERVPEYSVFLPIISGGGSAPITPATILGVPQYSQRDPRWANIRLGTGAATIAQQGCLITAVSAVCKYFGKDTDPAQLNRDLLRVGGYANGNLYKWWSLGAIYPDIRVRAYIDCQTVPAPLDKIDAELAAGRPPIVWVDFNPATAYNDMHWVVIVGHTEGRADYLIMDPWTGKIVPFRSLYSDPARYIFRIVTYAKG
jgi:lysozyme